MLIFELVLLNNYLLDIFPMFSIDIFGISKRLSLEKTSKLVIQLELV